MPGQRLRQLQHPVLLQARHLGRGLDGPPACEDRRDFQQRPLSVGQQAHAPFHRGPQGALPLGQIHRAGAERVQRGREPVQQRGRVQQPGPGGGQLDGQRQALQAATDLSHRRCVAFGEGKAGPHRAGPVHEQRHRRGGLQLRDQGSAGTGRQRRDRVFPLGPQPEHRTAGGQDRQLRAAGQQLAQVGRDLDHLLQVVQDQQPGAVAERLGQRLCRRARPRQVGARRPADGGQHQPGIGDRLQRHEHGARAEPAPQQLAYRHREPGLADPARPGQRHQPHPGLPEQIGHLADRPLPPEQRCRAHRQSARPAGARRRRRHGRGPAGSEPLAQQHRQVIAYQPAQLGGSAEMPVGRRRLLPDPGQQISQPRLTIGRRRLDIQQPRQPTRQVELILQARDLRAGDELPVPLPVQADEHIAAGQIRPVHLGRRIRPGPCLEHHRGQPQRRDSPRDRPPFLGQLTQRGTHEHPQPLVRSPDDRLILRSLAHRSPRSGSTTQVCNQPPRPASPARNQRRLQPPLRDT